LGVRFSPEWQEDCDESHSIRGLPTSSITNVALSYTIRRKSHSWRQRLICRSDI